MGFAKLAILPVVGSLFMVGCMVDPEEAVSEETLSEEAQGLGTTSLGYGYDEYDDPKYACGPSSEGVGKVAICHAPPGNPGNAHTICIGKPAVDAHLKNHPDDRRGACGKREYPKYR
jgi:hypothetical protein